jgi:nitrile hydratase accessory protein
VTEGVPRIDAEIREMDGDAALPRLNGELVFEAPWQSRAFGTAVALVRALGLDWDAFRARLVAAIAAEPGRPYYDSWLVALEDLAAAHGAVDRDALTARAVSLHP